MLLIAEPCRSLFAALGLNSFDSIVARFGDGESPSRTGVIVRPEVLRDASGMNVPVFFKQYIHHPPSLAFLGRASKARCEFDNYAVFTKLGLRCAERMACGEQRDGFGRLRSAFIITRAIPDAMGLIEFMTKRCPRCSGPAVHALRRSVLAQLAAMTRRIHAAGFYHHDLVWRNILVTLSVPDQPLVWWIDCPRGQFDTWSPWRRRRLLKDLASLDKSASKFCSRTERLAFVQSYLGRQSIGAEVRKLARDAIEFRRRRWPEDWNEN